MSRRHLLLATSLLISLQGLTWSQAHLDLRIGFATPQLEGAPSEEEFLNQVIGSELDSLEQLEACKRQDDPNSVARRMDRLAERLSMAIDLGEPNADASKQRQQLEDELADAVGLEEVLQIYQAGAKPAASDRKSRPQERGYLRHPGARDDRDPDGSKLLGGGHHNRGLYHGRRSLSDKGIMQVARLVSERALLRDEQVFSSEMFDHVAKLNEENPSDRLEQLKRRLEEAKERFVGLSQLGKQAVGSLYYWADQLYLNSNFLKQIPLLGVGLRELKKIGQRPYEIMDTVRYMHQLWMKFKKELPDKSSQTSQVLASSQTKRMLTSSGIEAIKLIAMRLLARGTGEGWTWASMGQELAAVQEIASRCAYYLFSQLVPRSPYCLIGRNYQQSQVEQLDRLDQAEQAEQAASMDSMIH